MCRFPASGSSRKSFARGCVPMDDPGCWQWVTREEAWAAVTLCNSSGAFGLHWKTGH